MVHPEHPRELRVRVMRCKLVSQFILLRICLGLGPGPSRPLASGEKQKHQRGFHTSHLGLSSYTHAIIAQLIVRGRLHGCHVRTRFFAAAFRPSTAARTPARAFFLSFSAARLLFTLRFQFLALT